MSTRIHAKNRKPFGMLLASREPTTFVLALLLSWSTVATEPSALCISYDGLPAVETAAVPAGMVLLPGGTFRTGSDRFYPEEAPVRDVTVGPFAIARHEVTNAQFAHFVRATSYRTVAERPLSAKEHPELTAEQRRPGSLVFKQPADIKDLVDLNQWWVWTPGTSWRAPEGPGSKLRKRMNHPVVHVAYEDALAYARWAGHGLPTEAEWEYAARGGLNGAPYTWGNEKKPGGLPAGNYWQGMFPFLNTNEDKYERTAPVGCFSANGFGLFDMAGNVWELTQDEYADSTGVRSGMKVAKGGSFLCADNFCGRYRPAARSPQGIDTGSQHVGFRTVWRPRSVDVGGKKGPAAPVR